MTDTSNFTVEVLDCTGVEELEASVMSIYPNPNHGHFVISISNDQKFNLIRIYDIMGKRQFEGPVTDKNIVLNNLVAGTYVVELSNETAVARKQIVVQ